MDHRRGGSRIRPRPFPAVDSIYIRRESSMYKDIIDTIGFVESYDPELGPAHAA